MIKTGTLTFLGLFFSMFLMAQSKTKWSIGASINPTFSTSINTTNSSEKVNGSNLTYKQYNDSVRSKESYRFNFGVTGWFNYALNNKWDLQAGLGYMDVGFQRNQKNIKFNDKLYPGIGNGYLTELSNNEKNIDYNYRYQYLHIPALFNYRVKKSGDYKITYSFTLGAAIDVLLRHKITANLDNFVVDNEKTFHLDSTGYGGRPFAFNIIVGGRVDYKIDKKYIVMVQPVIGFYPISVSSSPISVYPFYFSINMGLVLDLTK
jgi:hypothetical protein